MTKSDLGSRIKRFRLERDLSQAKLAVLLGISLSTVARLESGAAENVSDLIRAKIERQLEAEVPK